MHEELFTTSSLDGTIKIWSMKEPGSALNSIVTEKPVWSIAYNKTGDYIVSVSEHGTVTLINCSKAAEMRKDDLRSAADF